MFICRKQYCIEAMTIDGRGTHDADILANLLEIIRLEKDMFNSQLIHAVASLAGTRV